MSPPPLAAASFLPLPAIYVQWQPPVLAPTTTAAFVLVEDPDHHGDLTLLRGEALRSDEERHLHHLHLYHRRQHQRLQLQEKPSLISGAKFQDHNPPELGPVQDKCCLYCVPT